MKKKFQVRLKRKRGEFSNEYVVYDGKCTLSSEGVLEGYLECETHSKEIERSYIIGICDESSQKMIFLQFFQNVALPKLYRFNQFNLPGVWETYNRFNKGFFFNDDQVFYSVDLDIKEIADGELCKDDKKALEKIYCKEESLIKQYVDLQYVFTRYYYA